jgi:DNA segregation ATPase FtsK/SpoIIIE, S-DNA-T family
VGKVVVLPQPPSPLPLKVESNMATAKKNIKKKVTTPKSVSVEKDPPVSVKKVVRDERTHKIIGFFLILIAIWLFIAFVSYGYTWRQDQDKVFNAGGDFLFADDLKVDNKLGRLGAWISHSFIYKGFGIASYFLCLLPFVLGINLIFKARIFRIWRNVFYSLTGLIYFSVALAFFSKGAEFSYGGGWGEWISETLTAFMGTVGTALLLLVAGLAWFVWRFNPVFKMPKKPKISFPVPAKKGEPDEASLHIATVEHATEEGHQITSSSTPPQIIPATQNEQVTPAALPKEQMETQAVSVNTSGLSINELYALGRAEELAKNRFQVDEPVNPLEQQSVHSHGNSAGDNDSVSIILPEEQKPESKDPINQLTVSDKPIANGKGEPIFLINPIPEEKAATIVPPPVTPADEDVLSNTITHLSDGTSESQKNEVAALPATKTPKAETPSSISVIPPSDLELEIKPPAEDASPIEETPKEDKKTAHSKIESLEPYDPKLDLKGYQYPGLDLLETHGSEKIVTDAAELESNKNQIINTLKNYDIHIQRISATVGPTVTLYEIVPAPGVRISRIKNLEDDIALSLAALGIRIIAPIPGKGTIGIEVPNVRKTIVSMRTLLASEKFQNTNFSLPIAIGKKIDNELFVVDLASMPHLLMAGATGQGKSVGINAVLVSLLYKKHPSQLKLVLVDPKKVELSLYRAIEKHFLAKLPGEDESIITDTKKVVHTLNALCIEMDNRYDLLKEAGVRNIKEYNEKFIRRRLNPEKGHQFLPFIVLVIDEFADLIMTAGKEIEMPIARLAQLARAVGIHLIIATQRPSVNIITGTIKANFPSRVAFKVSSKIDSRTILDAGGAEQLIGKGDMLISHNGELIRLQCAFVDTPEVERVCEAIGEQRGYPEAFLLPEYVDEKEIENRDFDVNDRDNLFDEAARLIVHHQQGSTSLIQRRMKLGYNRAGRLMDQLEQAGVVGPNQGSKPRDVLVKTEMDLQELLARF